MEDSGISAFTPTYAAPEQWLPKRFGQTGTWTDVWGLALTAAETLLGRAPLDGDLAELMGTAVDPVRRPTPRNAGLSISDKVEAVFTKALAVSPSDRYPTVAAFWSELEEAIGYSAKTSVERTGRHESLPPEALAAAERELARPLPSLVFEGSLPSPPSSAARESAISPHLPQIDSRAKPPAPSPPTLGTTAGYGEVELDDEGISLRLDESERRLPMSFAEASARHGESSPQPPEANPRSGQKPRGTGVAGAGGIESRQGTETRKGTERGAVPELRNFEPQGSIGPTFDVKISDPPRRRVPAASPEWQPPPATARSLVRRLAGPLKLLGLSIGIMGADWLYTMHTGEVLAAGPLRPLWVAGPLGMLALGIIIYTVLSSD